MSGVVCRLSTCFVVMVWLGCQKSPGKPKEPSAPAIQTNIEIRDREGYLFTYLDEQGEQRTAERRDQIPESQRDAVRVIDLSLPPEVRGAGKVVYLADLRTPRPDGTFPYKLISSLSFQKAVLQQGEQAKVENALATAGSQVTIYTTSWCGVCQKAKAFLTAQGVRFVERDVEKDSGAQAEVSEKARRAGIRPQGVPVIDVYGELFVGFDEGALRAALQKRRG